MGSETQGVEDSPCRGATPSVSPVLSNTATAARKVAAASSSSNSSGGGAETRTTADRILLAVCVAGIMGSYLVYGVLQEQLYVPPFPIFPPLKQTSFP